MPWAALALRMVPPQCWLCPRPAPVINGTVSTRHKVPAADCPWEGARQKDNGRFANRRQQLHAEPPQASLAPREQAACPCQLCPRCLVPVGHLRAEPAHSTSSPAAPQHGCCGGPCFPGRPQDTGVLAMWLLFLCALSFVPREPPNPM